MLIAGEGAAGGEVNNPCLDSAEMEDWLLLQAPLLPPALPLVERTSQMRPSCH